MAKRKATKRTQRKARGGSRSSQAILKAPAEINPLARTDEGGAGVILVYTDRLGDRIEIYHGPPGGNV